MAAIDEAFPMPPNDADVFGPSVGTVAPRQKPLGMMLLEPIIQQKAITDLLSGSRGGIRSNLMARPFQWGSRDPLAGINDRAFSGAMHDYLQRRDGDAIGNYQKSLMDSRNVGGNQHIGAVNRQAVDPKLKQAAAQQRTLKTFRDLTKAEQKTRGMDPMQIIRSQYHSEIKRSKGLTPGERVALDRTRVQSREIFDSLRPDEQQAVARDAVARQGRWTAGRLANKTIMGAIAFGGGYEMGPSVGVGVGAGVMAAGLAHGTFSLLNGVADYQGHVGGLGGSLYSTATNAKNVLMGNPTTDLALEPGFKGRRFANGKSLFGRQLPDHGSRMGAIGAGVKKAVGRDHVLGLSPRNLVLYGGLIAAGGAASVITRAPVGGRLASRFAGGDDVQQLMNDPQNVEARMQAMAHLQRDTMSAVQAMGRESKYFLRQWTMSPTTPTYGVM